METLRKEYKKIQNIYGDSLIDWIFDGFNGYKNCRKDFSFIEIKKDLKTIKQY